MPQKKLPTIWNAPPHTIAKIEMLRAYLVAWFQILGRSRPGQDLLYVDGFAGPGEYLRFSTRCLERGERGA
jgi:three-Cys-motif partner protein